MLGDKNSYLKEYLKHVHIHPKRHKTNKKDAELGVLSLEVGKMLQDKRK